MFLTLHILAAFMGLVSTAFCYISPSQHKLYLSYALLGSTLISGIALVISTNAHLVSACFSGLAYLSVVSVGIYLSKLKLQKQKDK